MALSAKQLILTAALALVLLPATHNAQTTGTWQSRDVGAVAAAGSSNESGGVVTVRGSGADIWGTEDEFHIRYLPWSGDGEIVARVTGVTDTHPWAKAGVMFRESVSDAGSAHAFLCATPGNGVAFQGRTTRGALSFHVSGNATQRWLRLVRAGSTCTAYQSTDGTNWNPIGSQTITMSTVWVGFAVTSHNDGVLTTATFDSVRLSGASDATVPAAPGNLTANSYSNSQIELVWSDNSTNETGFDLERAPNGSANFVRITTTAANTRRFIDTGLTSGTSHDYRVRAISSNGASAYSNVAVGYVPFTNGPRAAVTLSARAVSPNQIDLEWSSAGSGPMWWEVERSTDNIAFDYRFEASAATSRVSDTTARPSTTYYYRVRSADGGGKSPYSNVASATTPAASDAAWTSRDIGTSTAGSTNVSGTSVTLVGSGSDIWNTADGFRFYYRRSSAPDSDMVVRVTGISDTHAWAKAGVMFRRSLDPGSPHTTMILSVAHGTALQYRGEAGAATGSRDPSEDGPAPRWLKLSRRGVTYYGYTSRDGVSWTLAGGFSNSTNTSTEPMYVGLVVTSHNDGVLCTATFDNVSFTEGLGPTPPPPSPSPPPAPTNLRAEVRTASAIELTWTADSGAQTGFELERANNTGPFFRLATLTATQRSHYDDGLDPGSTYTYRIRAVRDGMFSPYSNTVSATMPAGPPPPGTWLSSSVGPGTASGSSTESGGVHTVRGTGADIWGESDEFQYRYQPWTGNGEIIARVTSQQDTHGWAKAGVMFRAELNNLSVHASMFTTPSHGTVFQGRGASGSISAPASGMPRLPVWIRLVRDGQTFTGYDSVDGTTWRAMGSLQINMPDGIYVGMAVTSHERGIFSTAMFDHVQLVPRPGGTPPPAAPAWLRTNAISNSQIDLLWADSSNNETGFEVEHRLPGQAFVRIGTTAANVRTFSDTGLPSGQEVSYRVRAFNAGGHSAYSEIQSPRVPTTNGPTPAPVLSASAASPTRVDLNWTLSATAPTSGYEFLLERSTDGIDYNQQWTANAGTRALPDSNVTPATTYYYRIRTFDAGGFSPYSNRVTITTPATTQPPPPPGTWQSQDIGAVGRSGSAGESGGSVTMAASGEDIWGTADEFRYRHQPLAGNGELIVRVTGISHTHDWAKAGVMFRETLNANSRHAFMLMSARRGTAFQYRSATGGESGSTTPVAAATPIWLRIVRNGDVFTGFTSANGASWTQAGAVTLPGALGTMYVGLAVTSHDDLQLCTATFDNVTVTPSGPPPATPPNPPTALAAHAVSATQVNLSWTDQANNESGFEVERSTNNSTYTRIATTAANVPNYSDTGGSGSATYFYRVRALNAAGPSAYSNVASATTTAAPAWTFGDIGAVGVAGSNNSSGNTITVSASGADVWGTADTFRFVSRQVTGDGVVEARVSSMEYTDGWAKAGVMIRESREPNARNVFACVTPVHHGVVAQARETTGGETTSRAGPPRNAPYWVRLTRTGNSFTAASSPDGVAWTTYATFTIPMPATAHFGFAVTSHDNTRLNTAVFTDPFVQ